MSAPVVCTGLTKIFPGGVEAVAATDLHFAAGQTTALVGPSGCGKSTLLRIIAGLEQPTTGHVTIGDQPPAETLRQAGLSIAFQDPSLLPWRSVRQNIELALGLARRPKVASEIDQLIDLVGLSGFADTRPAELSGGMRQRAAIARALATQPALLLLDEPFGAVDQLTRQQLANAQVAADIAIELDRPRGPECARTPEFAAHVEAVFAALSRSMAETLPNAAQ